MLKLQSDTTILHKNSEKFKVTIQMDGNDLEHLEHFHNHMIFAIFYMLVLLKCNWLFTKCKMKFQQLLIEILCVYIL